MAKKPTSFSLSEDTLKLLKLISEKEKRSQANAIEIMVAEKAEKLKIKLQ